MDTVVVSCLLIQPIGVCDTYRIHNHIVVDKLLARKQTIIDSIVDQLKILSIEHTCHRITVNCIINLAGLIAYFAYLSL